MDRVLFSIIVPVYNTEKYVYKTINSIINQSFKDFEAILINDGSCDNSIAIAESLLLDSKINYKIVNQKHKGVSAARNEGIAVSQGKYLYFLDSDDYVDYNLLEMAASEIDNREPDIVFWNFDKVDENYNVVRRYNQNFITHLEQLTGEQLFINVLKEKVNFQISSAVYKKRIIEENNIRFYENCGSGEDEEFYLKVIYKAERTLYIDEDFFHHIIRKNTVNSCIAISNAAAFETFNRLAKYLENLHADKNFVWMVIYNKCPKEIIFSCNRIINRMETNRKNIDIPVDENMKKCLKRFKMWQFSLKELKCYIGIRIFLLNKDIYVALYKHVGKLRRFPAFSILIERKMMILWRRE
ncbi:glycosyltransferase family 2 protein [Clostridium oryzae]|uniref:Putative glycosyltransferase EpsJ n=1 Tax=Clostridium oryzae TaxID=1450648 RepID=A0A1V4IYS0_9CLOT|nr:glycosyltransferase family 2 protein [Clostridium oryzae]OPJ65049.1 putative glycosyltransferase EpsJ [Clostridium oryzae]